MPPPSQRMTKNQDRTHRHRPGKAAVQDESEDDESDDDVQVAPRPPPIVKTRRNLAATILPTAKKLPPAPIAKKPDIDLEGFVTASESSSEDGGNDDAESEDESEDSDESGSEEEDSESEEEVKPRLIAPKFISKAQRERLQATQQSKSEDELALEDEIRRKEKATELLQGQLEREQAARAAGRKAWDDDDIALSNDVDDTDDVDPEAEHAAWKLRELKRVRRDRLALIEKEKEREEIDRRKALTAEEREAEDRDFLEQQKADQEGRGKMAYMQKYFHKGAFFNGDEEQDEEVRAALTRDLAGARFVDEIDKDVLPEYMRIRDMTQLGRKSRSKYKDLKAEDTGRFGDFRSQGPRYDDRDGRRQEDGPSQTGANTAPLGVRRPRDEDDSRQDGKRARYE